VVNANRRSGFNTNSPSPPAVSTATLKECSSLLFVLDPEAAATRVTDGVQACPASDCSGFFQPWGSARTRPVRLLGGGTDSVTPRRARCRQCDRTHVFIPVRAFPRRTDSIETVWAALAAAAQGLGHRKVAEQVGVPATTVRGWLRRARANSDIIANRARIFRSDLERYKPDHLPKFDTPLACMVHTVADAACAWKRRFGTTPPVPGLTGTLQQIASFITGGWLLIANVPLSKQWWRPG
jgi:hypothetical protein